MLANQPTWTAERLDLLKRHFEAGLSCSQIAADIGVSRNAVIGKLSRLNLKRGKMSETRLPQAKQAERKPRVKPGVRVQYRMLTAIYPEAEPAIDDTRIEEGHGCSLLELSGETCRWPIGTPGAEDFCFCGNAPIEGMSYCSGHTRLAYRPGSRLRVMRR